MDNLNSNNSAVSTAKLVCSLTLLHVSTLQRYYQASIGNYLDSYCVWRAAVRVTFGIFWRPVFGAEMFAFGFGWAA